MIRQWYHLMMVNWIPSKTVFTPCICLLEIVRIKVMSDGEYEYEEYDDIQPRSDEEEMYDDDCRERAEDMRKELK